MIMRNTVVGAIPEIKSTITIPFQVSSIVILLRYQKLLNLGAQACREGGSFPMPRNVWMALPSLRNIIMFTVCLTGS